MPSLLQRYIHLPKVVNNVLSVRQMGALLLYYVGYILSPILADMCSVYTRIDSARNDASGNQQGKQQSYTEHFLHTSPRNFKNFTGLSLQPSNSDTACPENKQFRCVITFGSPKSKLKPFLQVIWAPGFGRRVYSEKLNVALLEYICFQQVVPRPSSLDWKALALVIPRST